MSGNIFYQSDSLLICLVLMGLLLVAEELGFPVLNEPVIEATPNVKKNKHKGKKKKNKKKKKCANASMVCDGDKLVMKVIDSKDTFVSSDVAGFREPIDLTKNIYPIQIDYDTLLDKTVKAKVEDMLEIVGLKWEDILKAVTEKNKKKRDNNGLSKYF